MQQSSQTQASAIRIQEDEARAGVILEIGGQNVMTLHLSVVQARLFASDLIQYAHRIDVKQNLKKRAKSSSFVE